MKPTTKVFVTWFAPVLVFIHFHVGINLDQHILNTWDKFSRPFTENDEKTSAFLLRWQIIDNRNNLYCSSLKISISLELFYSFVFDVWISWQSNYMVTFAHLPIPYFFFFLSIFLTTYIRLRILPLPISERIPSDLTQSFKGCCIHIIHVVRTKYSNV